MNGHSGVVSDVTTTLPSNSRIRGNEMEFNSTAANFVDPITAVQRAHEQEQKQQATNSSRPTTNLRFTISPNANTTASASSSTTTATNSSPNVTNSSHPTISMVASSTPSTPATGGGGAKFVIIPKSSPKPTATTMSATNTRSASPVASPSATSTAWPSNSAILLPIQPTATPVSPSDPSPRPSISDPTATTEEILQRNASRPLEQPSPAMIPFSPSQPISSIPIVTLPSASSHDNADVPIKTDLPATHPAATVRPPTPPTHNKRRSISKTSDKRNSRSLTMSPGLIASAQLQLASSGTQSIQAHKDHSRKTSEVGDQVSSLPIPALTNKSRTASPRQSGHNFNMSIDASNNEFSTALRAALADAAQAGGVSGQHSMKSRKQKGINMFDDPEGSPRGITPTIDPSSPLSPSLFPPVPTDAEEREARKQAIRAKNALHMRIRNASVGGNMLSGSRTNAAMNRAAVAAAANAANAAAAAGTPPGFIPVNEMKGVNRTNTGGGPLRANTFSSGGATFKSPPTPLKVPGTLPESEESKSLLSPSNLPPSELASPSGVVGGFLSPTSLQASPVRTRSGILKSGSSPTAPAKRQISGILRSPSMKSGGTSMTAMAAAAAASATTVPTIPASPTAPTDPNGPPLARTNTTSRVGFVIPIGENANSDSDSSSTSGTEDDEPASPKIYTNATQSPLNNPNVRTAGGIELVPYSTNGQLINTNAGPLSEHSPKSNRAGSSVGISSLHPDGHDDPTKRRKEVFVQNGDQLELRSVSTTAGGSTSTAAANVMVLSVSSIFTRLRLYTDLCFYLAMLGIVLTVINKELHYRYPDDELAVQSTITAVRALTSLSTIALIYCLYQYYKADFQFLQLNRVYLLRSATWNTQLIWQFALEVVICLIHEPPYLNHDIDLSVTDAATIQQQTRFTYTGTGVVTAANSGITPVIVRNPWSLLICLRFYFFLRLILSRYYTGGTKILGLWFNFNFNIPFAIRNMLYSHPLLSLAPVVGALIFGCSYSLWVFEREALEREFSFGTALWVVMITITAVGYGDITPQSSGGRAICILSAFIGIMVTAVLVAAVHQKLTLLPYEGRMVEFLERDSNTMVLKYYASRCISRSWQYYSFRRKAIRMVAARKFNVIHRANLLRYKTKMLQGIFDFQTARKQIQAYDRRYHSEQLFRSMLEGLYDKLENMTLDFHVLEDELDLSYEEQRKIGNQNYEILEQVRAQAKTLSSSAAIPLATGAPPEHGRLSLLRTASMPTVITTTPHVPGSITPADPAVSLTREPSIGDSMIGMSGRNSALDLAPQHEGDITNRHQSIRGSTRFNETTAEHSVSDVNQPITPASKLATPGSMNFETALNDAKQRQLHTSNSQPQTQQPSPVRATPSPQPTPVLTGPQLSTVRTLTGGNTGGLDLAAAAAKAIAATNNSLRSSHRRHGSTELPNNPAAPSTNKTVPASSSGGRDSVRAKSTQDLMTGIVVETPPPHNAPVLNKRASLTKDVTTDLLNVVAALSPTNNPELTPTPAGRIRFGEADFAAHRASNVANRSGRQTIMIQRGKTGIDRPGSIVQMTSGLASMTGPNISPDGSKPENMFRVTPSYRRLGSIEMPGTSGQQPTTPHSNTAGGGGDERNPSPNMSTPTSAGMNRPTFNRLPSTTGSVLRAAATARAAAQHGNSVGITTDQFERMMGLLTNVSERLNGVEQQLLLNTTPQPSPHRKRGHHHSQSHIPPNVLAQVQSTVPPITMRAPSIPESVHNSLTPLVIPSATAPAPPSPRSSLPTPLSTTTAPATTATATGGVTSPAVNNSAAT